LTLAGQGGIKAAAGRRMRAGDPGAFVDPKLSTPGAFQFNDRAMKMTTEPGSGLDMYITGMYRLNDPQAADAFVLKLRVEPG
jgi:hypothetical protein